MKHINAMFFCWYLLFAYILYAEAGQRGESTAPPLNRKTITIPATLKVDPVQKIRIGSFEATFEKTTLGQIRDVVGAGLIQYNGDAAISRYWLCYSLQSQRIWFISHGEMGGDSHVLTQVQSISINSTSHEIATCPQIPTEYQSISFNFGWIGTTQDILLKSLGQPSGTQDGRLAYYYVGKKQSQYKGQNLESDVIGYVEALIVDNKVFSLYASHVTSY